MSPLSRRWIAIGALVAALGVGLGAYGAHGLRDTLLRAGYTGEDLAHRLEIWNTAVRYQMFHAIALVLTGLILGQRDSKGCRVAAWLFLAGILLFCGTLKVLTFAGDDWRWLGAVTPFGGGAMIAAWITMAVCALKK